MSDSLSKMAAAAAEAGKILMKHFGSRDLAVRRKADESQVTDADLASSHYLASVLPGILPAPILCEEAVVPYEERRNWKEYWLVDPLDGTKDFLAGEKDFTVCIAFLKAGEPVLAVIHAPALGETYEAEKGKGAFFRRGAERRRISVKAGPPWRAVRSRFHDGAETAAFFERNKLSDFSPLGSALKFGRVADGTANLFVRLRGCHEWDVAAGHLIVEEAGGELRTIPEGGVLRYNGPNTKVEPFFACANRGALGLFEF